MKTYRGVLARPGYNPKYKTEVSWDELKRSALLYKRLPMIVAGGDHAGPIDPNKAVGHVDQVIDEEKGIIYGDYVFHKERFEEIPAEIQRMLAHKEYIRASLGYEPFDNLRKYDHVAIGVKSPVFEDVGFHAESNFRYEETEGINTPEPETEAPVQKEEPKPKQDIGFNEVQMNQIREIFASLAQAPSVTTTEEVVKEEPTEEPPEEEAPSPEPAPEVEPERIIPLSTPAPKAGEWYTDESGRRVMSIKTLGSEKTK